MLACGLVSFISIAPESPEWGFFGHKRINRLAVLTLPPPMMAFFKPHIDYLTDHAVDPDMRRYASKHEGPRHFIDLDNYGPPFDSLPRLRAEAMQYFTEIWVVKNNGDTVLYLGGARPAPAALRDDYKRYFNRQVLPRFYKDVETLDADSLSAFALTHGLPGDFKSAFFSGFNKSSTVPAGNFSKAAFIGANTVNGPVLLSASTNSAALTAATNVLWSLLPTAT